MLANTPDFIPAIEAVRRCASDTTLALSPIQQTTLLEVARRLKRLSRQAAELVEINNKLGSQDALSVTFDPTTDTVVFAAAGVEQRLKLRRADPNVPIAMRNLTSGAAYVAGEADAVDEEQETLRIELEEKVESYYQSAHRILKLFGTIPALATIRCEPISRVRNNLVEHPQEGALYSFGYGSTGPRVKPMHRGTPLWNDDGLVPNTEALLGAIETGCSAGAP